MQEILLTSGEVLVALLILAGALLSALSSFGLIRLPDMYLRSHAAAKITSLGVLTVLLGAFLYFWIFEGYVSAKLLLGIMFVFITAPIASHLLGRAAYHSGVPMWDKSERDDLKEVVDTMKDKERTANEDRPLMQEKIVEPVDTSARE
ncbi:Na+/H+ antiporter subunit G [Paenibacillaceae bacterium]|nr:Na+/H+ antiporter subunit G [Paenibacillaceae bacterium]